MRAKNTLHVSEFWSFFNNILSPINTQGGYTFNPKVSMIHDINNCCSIQEVYYIEGILKAYSFQ